MNDDPDDHTAHSTNGHDERAAGDLFGPRPMADGREAARQAARQRAREALADTIGRYGRVASAAYGSIHAALRDADEALSLCDVGPPPPVDGDASAYERNQVHHWEKNAITAERRAPSKLRRLARDLRRMADRIEEEIGSS